MWPLLSAAYFILLLSHFLVTQSAEFATVLTFSGNRPVLAAFWGMIVFTLMSPFILLMIRYHAAAYALHDWSWRIPAPLYLSLRSKSPYRPVISGFSLLCLLVLPLYAQGHFLIKFYKEGAVYIYPEDFGFTTSSGGLVHDCSYDGKLCRHTCADRFSLVTQVNGADGCYWDNCYHYGWPKTGATKLSDGDTVTFWPILQPIVILMITAISSLLSFSALILIFRPPAASLVTSV